MRRIGVLLFLIALAALSQIRFETTTDLVVVDVNVRDREGRPVEGLKKEDFTIFEDGKPQKIAVFEFQRLTLEPLERAGGTPSPARPLAQPAPPAMPPRSTRGAPVPRYQDRRLLVFFFDLSAMSAADQIRAQEAALKFLNQNMTRADLVSIMTFSSRLQVIQDFTDDRDRLTEVIRGLRVGAFADLADLADVGNDDAEQDTGAAFVADSTEFNIFNTDRKLSALESAVKKLSALPEKKALVYFSSGVGKTGVENQSQLRATVNAAIRSNVSFYPVDARGLAALPPGGDASKAASRGQGMFSGYSVRKDRDKFNSQQETLTSLAADTGGKAFLDSNDLAVGIVQAQTDTQSYYI